MDCKHAGQLISALIDNELDAAGAASVRAHLDGCASCRAAAAQLQELRGAVRGQATRHAAPPELRARILKQVRAAQPRRSPWSALPWAWINFAVAGVSTAAFALTLALYVQQPSSGERLEQEIVASHFRSLAPDHLADVASSDQHTVKPWFAGKLDFSPPVYDLAQQGYALVGGRVDYVNQRPVAALAYRHLKHVLNLYVWPDAGVGEAAPRTSSRQGYQLLQWSQQGMHFVAISDMNAQDLGSFSTQVRAKIAAHQLPMN